MTMQQLHIEDFDRQTPVEAYIGRMVTELLKAGKLVQVETIPPSGDVRFTILDVCGKRICLQKAWREIDLLFRPLNAANYDAEEILRK